MRLHEVFDTTLTQTTGTRPERLRATLRSMRKKAKRSNPSKDLTMADEQDPMKDEFPVSGALDGGRE